MKKIRNICIDFSLNEGKDDILYESIQEVKEYFPNVKLSRFNRAMFRKFKIGFVKCVSTNEEYRSFIYVSDKDKFEIIT